VVSAADPLRSLISVSISLYKVIILPLVLFGLETWYLTLREEHRLRVFENRVLKKVIGKSKDEMVGGCRKLHGEDLCELYSSLQLSSVASYS
jgi:hypothetical protein